MAKAKVKKSKEIETADAIDGPSDWRADVDMRTLAEAEEIKGDPKRFAAAKKKAMERIDELETVFGEDDEKDD
jgi:hypothetical protein